MPKLYRPKLGQHFLADSRYRTRIAQALGLRPDDLVIEIGPGHGAITPLLAEQARQVTAVEVDPALAGELQQKLESRVEIINADILAADIAAICRRHQASKCFVFGNLPYYITSPILHHLLQFAGSIRAMGLLVQREVALRLAASPGSRDYGYLTVLVALYASPHIAFEVPPGAFSPPPKVHSALVYFAMQSPQARIGGGREEAFRAFLKQCFSQKRKKLLNCLAAVYPRERVRAELERVPMPLNARAEELSLDDFIKLFTNLAPASQPSRGSNNAGHPDATND